MASFFSPTDTNTLLEEGTALNHFLSLIVNNAGQYVARLTRKIHKKTSVHIVTTTKETSYYNSFENIKIPISDNKKTTSTKDEIKDDIIIEYFDLNICKSTPNSFADIDERLQEIKNIKSNNLKNKFSSLNNYQESKTKKINDNLQQLSLFQSCDSSKIPIRYNSFDEEEYLDDLKLYLIETVPEEIIKSLCIQILSGSVLAYDKDFNFNNWASKMDVRWERRFGNLDNSYNYEKLKNFLISFIDALIGYSVNKEYEDDIAQIYGFGEDYEYNDTDEFIWLYANDIIKFLETLPKGKVINLIIEKLNDLIPE